MRNSWGIHTNSNVCRRNLADFAGELAATFSPLAQASGAELRVEADVELERVKSDQRRLRQMAAKLILNALRYRRRRNGTGSWVRVSFGAEPGERWRLAVEDNGAGIAPEDLERIFGAFQRGAYSEGVQGSGLNLTITQHLADLLGGKVRVRSTLGEGSRFEVDLPRACPKTPPGDPGAERQR